jgi:hypothetical protein
MGGKRILKGETHAAIPSSNPVLMMGENGQTTASPTSMSLFQLFLQNPSRLEIMAWRVG